MIVRDRWRDLGTVKKIVPTGKDLPVYSGEGEEAYWRLAGMIEDRFGPEGASASEIYHEVTGPLGLSSITTSELIKSAKQGGYLK